MPRDFKLALFDLDHTLLPLDSDHAWGEFTTRLGWTDAGDFKRANDAFYASYQAGTLDIHAYVRFTLDAARRRGKQQAEAAHARFMREVIEPAITPQALALLDAHRRAGEHIAIVTATNAFITRPIARRLGVEDLIAIELERGAEGWITGEIAGTPSFREGKVTRVEQWLRTRGLDWSDAEITFYSDSRNDLPLLEKADHPVAANPDAALREIARQRGWRVLDLFGHEMHIGKTGKIISGEYAGWSVEIVDDSTGDTGGFYVLQSSGTKRHDDWVENEDSLRRYFRESNWVIEWEE